MIASTDEELSLTRHWVACLPQVNEWPHLVPLRDRLSALSRGGNWACLFTLPRSHSWKVAEFESRSVCPGLWWVSTRPRSNDHVKRRNVSALLTSRCLLNRVLQRPVLQAEQGDAAQARARRELTPVSRGRSAGRCARRSTFPSPRPQREDFPEIASRIRMLEGGAHVPATSPARWALSAPLCETRGNISSGIFSGQLEPHP